MASLPPGQHTKIPDNQWNMPVSFHPNGQLVTLRQVQQGQPYIPWAELTLDKRADLTARRIELKPDFRIGTIGSGGVIDKNRALAEVRALTDVGKDLIDIEGRVVADLLREVESANA